MDEYNLKEIYKKHNRMFKVIIELTTCCTHRCIHCYINDHGKVGLNKKQVYQLLEELREFGVYEVQFTGGEIFTRDDVFDIIAYARKLYFKVILLTNLSLLNEKSIEKLEELNVQKISTTLFSMNDVINDRITNSYHSATKVINNLLLLKKTNIELEIKTVVMRENANEYRAIDKFCKENGIEFLATEGLFAKSDGSLDPYSYYLEYEQLCECIEYFDCIRCHGLYHEKKNEDDSMCCDEIFYSLFVDSSGDIYPCNLWYKKVGNVLKDRVSDVWECEFILNVRKMRWRDIASCAQCQDKDFCVRCTGMAESLSGSILGKDNYACRTAKIRHAIYDRQHAET